MDSFKLRWRWTDKQYCLLKDSELSLIHPLDKKSSAEAWDKSLHFIDKKSEFSPSLSLFHSIESIDTTNTSIVSAWLINRLSSEDVIVSWQPDTAIKTTSELFIKYWDEFCYPASDDVSVWPVSESWVLHFWHYEKMCFGKANTSVASEPIV